MGPSASRRDLPDSARKPRKRTTGRQGRQGRKGKPLLRVAKGARKYSCGSQEREERRQGWHTGARRHSGFRKGSIASLGVVFAPLKIGPLASFAAFAIRRTGAFLAPSAAFATRSKTCRT